VNAPPGLIGDEEEDLEDLEDLEGLGCPSKEAYGNAVLSLIEFPEDAATPLHRGKFSFDSGTVFFVGISHEVSLTQVDY